MPSDKAFRAIKQFNVSRCVPHQIWNCEECTADLLDKMMAQARLMAFEESRNVIINSAGDIKIIFTCIETEIREAERLAGRGK